MLKIVEALRGSEQERIINGIQGLQKVELDIEFLSFFWHTSLH